MIKSQLPLPRVDKGAAVPLLLLLFALFLLAFTLRAIFPDTSYFFWDESVYMLHGKLFAGQEVGYSETFLRPPLLPLLLSPLAALSQHQYELASRLLVAFLNSLVVFPVYHLTKVLFNKLNSKLNKRTSATTVAFVAAAIIAFLPLHILNSRWVMTDALGALLAFSSVAAYVLGFWQRQQQNKLIYLGGVLAGLAVLMKFTNLLLLVLLLPLMLFNFKNRFKEVVVSALLFCAVMLPYIAFNVLSFGSPFYAFQRAFHVVAEESPVSVGFFLYLLKDAFGILLAFLAFGLVLSVFHLVSRSNTTNNTSKSTESHYLLYFLYCLIAALAYSFFVISKGVSKPAGIGWEAERFMLLFVLFAVPFISYGITQSFMLLKNLRRAVAVANPALAGLHSRKSCIGRTAQSAAADLRLLPTCAVVIAVVAAAAIFSLYPQFVRAYAPAIVHEDGLRNVTKEMGLFLRSNSEVVGFGCVGNCPPVAYYSGKKMSVYYTAADLEAANYSNVVVFDDKVAALSGSYGLVKDFCSGSHCAYFLGQGNSESFK